MDFCVPEYVLGLLDACRSDAVCGIKYRRGVAETSDVGKRGIQVT